MLLVPLRGWPGGRTLKRPVLGYCWGALPAPVAHACGSGLLVPQAFKLGLLGPAWWLVVMVGGDHWWGRLVLVGGGD